jgi:hypothetical protein
MHWAFEMLLYRNLQKYKYWVFLLLALLLSSDIFETLITSPQLRFIFLPGYLGIAMGYGLDGQGSILGQEQEIFIYSTVSRPALDPAQSPIQRVP